MADARKVIEFVLSVSEAGTTPAAAAHGLDRMAKSAKKAGIELDGVKDRGKKLGGELAELGGTIGGIPVPGFEQLGVAITIAGDTVESFTNPVGALTILLAGAGAASIATAAALGLLVASADDWIAELEDVNSASVFTEDQLAAVESANVAIDAVGVVAKQVAVIFASELAPTVEQIAVQIVTFGVAGRQAIEGVGSSVGGLVKAFDLSISQGLRPFALVFAQLNKVLIQTTEVMAQLGGPDLGDGLRTNQALLDSIISGQGILSSISIAGTTGFGSLGVDMSEAAREARELLATIGEVRAAERADTGGEATKDTVDAMDELAESVDGLMGMLADLEAAVPTLIAQGIAGTVSGLASAVEGGVQPMLTFLAEQIPILGGIAAAAVDILFDLPQILLGLGPALADIPGTVVALIGDLLSRAIPGFLGALPDVLRAGVGSLDNLLVAVVGSLDDLILSVLRLPIELPIALAEALFSLLQGLFLDLPQAFAEAIADLIKGIVQPVDTFLSGESRGVLGDVGGAIGGIGKGIGHLVGGIADAIPFLAGGGTIVRTGLAVVHEGEQVGSPDRLAASGLGGGVHIGTVVVHGTDERAARDMLRKFRELLGPRGLNESLTAF